MKGLLSPYLKPSRALRKQQIAWHELGHLIMAEVSEDFKPVAISLKRKGNALAGVATLPIRKDLIRDNRSLTQDIFIDIGGYVNQYRINIKVNPIVFKKALHSIGGRLDGDLGRALGKVKSTYNNNKNYNQIIDMALRERRLAIGQSKGLFTKTFQPLPKPDEMTNWLIQVAEGKDVKAPEGPSIKPPPLKPIPQFKHPHSQVSPRYARLDERALTNRRMIISMLPYIQKTTEVLSHVPDSTLHNMINDLTERGGEIEGRQAIATFIRRHISPQTLANMAKTMQAFSEQPLNTYYGLQTTFPKYLKLKPIEPSL